MCKEVKTSGSTGIPLSILFTHKDTEFYNLMWARASIECGQRLWDSSIYLKPILSPRLRFWFNHLGIWKRQIITYGDTFEKQIETLRRIRPNVIKGHGPKLFELARLIKENGIDDIRPRMVITSAYTLDHNSREMIESAFGSEVFDFYGAFELGLIAWECSEHNGYHINCDSLVLELIKDDRAVPPGEMGKIVCTGLHSFAMPFIRYEISDVGILSDEKCPCGRGLPLLKSLEGRTDDMFVTPGGYLYTTPELIPYIGLIPGIDQFKVIQESLKCVTIKITPGKNFSEETIKQIKETFLKVIGGDFDIEVKVVDKIPPDPSGKIRSIISKVNKEL